MLQLPTHTLSSSVAVRGGAAFAMLGVFRESKTKTNKKMRLSRLARLLPAYWKKES